MDGNSEKISTPMNAAPSTTFVPNYPATTYPSHYYQGQQPGSAHGAPLAQSASNPSFQSQPQHQHQQQHPYQQQFQPQQQHQFQQQFQPSTQQRSMPQPQTTTQNGSPMFSSSQQYNLAHQSQRNERFSQEYPQAKGQPKMHPSAKVVHSVYRPVQAQSVHEMKAQQLNQPITVHASPKLPVVQQPIMPVEPVLVKARRGRAKAVVQAAPTVTSDVDMSDFDSAENEMQEEAFLNHKLTIDQLDKLNKKNYGTDPEYLEHLNALKAERDDFIEYAFLFKQHQIETARALCKAEIEQYGLRAKIQASLEDRKRKILADRDTFEINGDDKIQAATRSKIARVVAAKTDEKKERKRKGNSILCGLKDHEIYEDMDIFRKLSLTQPQNLGGRVGKAVKR